MINTIKKQISFWYLLFTLLFGLILFLVIDTNRHPNSISITVGRENGAYMQYALLYKKILWKKYHIQLKIIDTKYGSTEAQERVLSGEADFAIAQSGTEKEELLILANIAYEPIWIFYTDDNITGFRELYNRQNNIEKPKSGTYPIAKILLETIGTPIEKQKTLTTKVALEQLQKGKVDSLFLTIGTRASILKNIIDTPNIKLLDFKEALSYQKNFIKRSENNNYEFNKTNYFHVVKVEQGALDISRNIPKKKITLLAVQTILVTKTASDEISRLLLKVVTEVHSKASFLNEQYHFPNTSMFKLKQHPASVAYFKERIHRYEEYNLLGSFFLAQSLKKIEELILLIIIPIGLFGFFIEVIHPGIRMLTRREINRWYRKVNKSDTNIDALNLDELKERRIELEGILKEIQNRDNLDPVHLEAYYSLQNQITNTLESFDKRIEQKEAQQIYL
jgi:TRAP-type uncharacterized transport system substrate-binding protein